MKSFVLCIVLVVAGSCWCAPAEDLPADTTTLDLRMPGVTPDHDDQYICTSFPLPTTTQYIVRFEPHAKMNTAHHMLMYGCQDVPTMNQQSWDCELTYTICSKGSKIMFAWARNAPTRDLPKDVGFRVGKPSDVNYLVLQVHYASTFADNHEDSSGLTLYMTQMPQSYIAGIFLLATGYAHIPAHKEKVHADISCAYRDFTPIHPFAFRVHAHSLGRVISGYIYKKDEEEYVEIGKGNPQWPQAFYPTDEIKTVKAGDILMARCTYNSMERDTPTDIGPTHNDEMCNLYIMYYTDANHGNTFGECGQNMFAKLMKLLPEGNDVELPPNPQLEGELDVSDTDHPHPHDDEDDNQPSSVKKVLPTRHFMEDETWKMSVKIGDVGGVAVNKDGDVLVFHRGNHKWQQDSFDAAEKYQKKKEGPILTDTILVVDADTGMKKNSWGANMFYLPHAIYVDPDGNVWVSDVALHQVLKFPPGGASSPTLKLGRRFEPGSDLQHFCKPADVAVATTGEIFVADGYCNHRVMKFSPDGRLLQQWSIAEEGSSALHIVHSITLVESTERRGEAGRQALCVADREEGRIRCFDFGGDMLANVAPPGMNRIFAIAYSPRLGGVLHGITGPPLYGHSPAPTGFTLNIEKNSMSDKWIPTSGNFASPHDMALSQDGSSIFVGEIKIPRVWKFSLVDESAPIVPARNQTANSDGVQQQMTANMESTQLNVSVKADTAGVSPGLIVVCLLAVPVLLILGVAACMRLRQNARGRRFNLATWMSDYKATSSKFNIGGLLNRHHGFDPLSQEESDHEPPVSDSDVEEYSVAPNSVQKA